jgi:hypothetical protein
MEMESVEAEGSREKPREEGNSPIVNLYHEHDIRVRLREPRAIQILKSVRFGSMDSH